MLHLRHLRTFLAAADTLSFTQAGERVHLSQPSVTEQVRTLEASLGRALFHRANNRLTLTDAGRTLAARARELLAMADATLAAVRDDGPVAALRVAAPQTLCARLVAPLVQSLAGVGDGLHLALLERNSADTERCVLDGTADLGVLHGWPRAAGGLQAEAIGRDAPVVLCATGDPLAEGDAVDVGSLARSALVLTPPGCRLRDYVDALLQQGSVRPRIRAEADGAASLARLVAAGAGVAVLPRMAADAAVGDLPVQVRPLRGAGAGLPVCLVHAAGRPVRPAVAAFMGLLRSAAGGLHEPVAALDVQHLAGGVAVAQ